MSAILPQPITATICIEFLPFFSDKHNIDILFDKIIIQVSAVFVNIPILELDVHFFGFRRKNLDIPPKMGYDEKKCQAAGRKELPPC